MQRPQGYYTFFRAPLGEGSKRASNGLTWVIAVLD